MNCRSIKLHFKVISDSRGGIKWFKTGLARHRHRLRLGQRIRIRIRLRVNFVIEMMGVVQCVERMGQSRKNSEIKQHDWTLQVTWWVSTNHSALFQGRLATLLGKMLWDEGGSPGLVVMGNDSCLRGSGFESWRRILDAQDIFHIDLFKNCIDCLKRPKINKKRPGLARCKNVMRLPPGMIF